jgi:hypothetical protein
MECKSDQTLQPNIRLAICRCQTLTPKHEAVTEAIIRNLVEQQNLPVLAQQEAAALQAPDHVQNTTRDGWTFGPYPRQAYALSSRDVGLLVRGYSYLGRAIEFHLEMQQTIRPGYAEPNPKHFISNRLGGRRTGYPRGVLNIASINTTQLLVSVFTHRTQRG